MHVFFYKAKDAELRGDHEAAERDRVLSAMCNLGAIVTFLIVPTVVIVLVATHTIL